MPGQTPAAEPTRPTIAASHPIMRRIWPGVAATARSSAISRSRCWIDRPIVLVTTNIAMNSASPANAAVTAISVIRACWSSGCSALPRASPVSTCAPPAAARRREASKPGPASTPIASTRPGWPASRAASASVRKIAVCCETAWRGPGDAHDRDRAGGLGGGERQPRAERGAVAGDDLAGSRRARRPALSTYGVSAALLQPWATAVPAAEAGRHRHVADRRPDAGHGRQPSGERGVHAGALAERHVVVGADDLLPGHDGGRAGVALDGRMAAQRGLELHAAGHDESSGRGDQRDAARR